jgi:hypothetical protein
LFSRADLKAINSKQPNIFRRSYNMLAVKPRKSSGTKSTNLSPIEKTINLDFGKLKPPNLTLPPYPANDYFVPSLSPTQKTTKLMEFHRMMGVRSTSLIPAMERTTTDFVKNEKEAAEELKSEENGSKMAEEPITRNLGKPLNLPNIPSASVESQPKDEQPQTSNDSEKPPIPPTRRSLLPQSPSSESSIPLPTQWQPIAKIEVLDDHSTLVCIDPDGDYDKSTPASSVINLTRPETSSSSNPYSIVDLTALNR